MKVRDSGMPEESYWESLVAPEQTLSALGFGEGFDHVVEVGCGYGTFTIPAARKICGLLTAIDIDPEMVERTQARARELGVRNICVVVRDVLHEGTGLPSDSQDACLLFNILHAEDPVNLLNEAARVVKPGGLVLVTHWRYDDSTPRGPSLDIRPRPEDIQRWAVECKTLVPEAALIALPPYHYGLRLHKLIRHQ